MNETNYLLAKLLPQLIFGYIKSNTAVMILYITIILGIQKVSNDAAKLKSFKIMILKSDLSIIKRKSLLPSGVGIKILRKPRRLVRNNNNDGFN